MAARSYNVEEYQMSLDILRTGEYGEEINCWLHNADLKMWCRSLFPIPRFGITTSNPVKILFSTLRNCWHYPAFGPFLYKLTFFLSVLRDGISLNKWKMSWMAQQFANINQQSVEAVYYHVQWTGLSTAVILTTATSMSYAVDISKNECSCGFYQEVLVPCRHAIKFLTSIRRDPKDYCSDIQTVEYLREMYAEGADPLHVTVINDLPSDPLIPLTVETLRGRRRKNKIE